MPTPEVTIVHDPTTRISNVMDTLTEMQQTLWQLVKSLDCTDYIVDTEREEWHPVSVTHDLRRDAVDAADDLLRDAVGSLNTAFKMSRTIDRINK